MVITKRVDKKLQMHLGPVNIVKPIIIQREMVPFCGHSIYAHL